MMGSGPIADDLEVGFVAVRNDEGQYSVWWRDRPVPAGWTAVGPPEPRQACLDRIGQLWTDVRPASLRVRVAAPADPTSAGDRAAGASGPEVAR